MIKSQRIIGIIFFILAGFTAGAEPVTIQSLLQEMIDPTALARIDSPSYSLGQFSSYDRRSVAPDQPGWFANEDGFGFIREESRQGRTEEVMMEADGPGAIVRWWMTMAGPHNGWGTIRVYIDGESEPRIKGKPYDLVGRGLLAPEPLSASVSTDTWEYIRGHNLYLPIPYEESCKVTFEREGEGPHFFVINYRSYEPGTPVESYTPQAARHARPVSRTLHHRQRPVSSDWSRRSFEKGLAPGDSIDLELEGPAAIREMRFRLAADDLEQALRSTVLAIEFDGRRTVWAPVGDFFGTGHQIAPYEGWYSSVGTDGMLACWWVMPFAESARVSLRNLGDQSVEINWGVLATGDWIWDARSLYFHATWRQLYQYHARGSGNPPAIDYNYVTIRGRGKYVGDTLTAYNYSDHWWGEGDEKIYVDGEDFPSHFGTGTEDYYGYAWGQPATFDHPFIAQPEGRGGGMTRDPRKHAPIVNSRWRALDAIPFRESLQVDMEIWTQRKAWMNYAPTTFFYARPGASTNVEPDPAEARKPVPKQPTDVLPVTSSRRKR